MHKMNFSERVNGIFAAMDTNYEEMNNLMQDVALGREIYDEETGRAISKAEANAKILAFSKQVLGIEEGMSKKEVDRAFRDNGRAWFDIIEDTVDLRIVTGLQATDWFNDLVENKTIKYGDRQDFIVETEDAVLSVAKAGTSHHDHAIQRLRGRQVITVPTELYAIKVGADINRYILGQEDWSKLVDAIAIAYEKEIQDQIFAEVDTIASKLPITDTRFINTGALSAGTKDDFDAIIENVSAANNGAEVVIMGTKSALSKISALADVQWGATAQKDSVMNTGNIGIYEGTKLVTIPNRFKDRSMNQKVFNPKRILILPVISDEGKFVKFIDEGETRILQKEETGDYLSDLMTYEVQRRFGVATVVGRQLGQWTLP